MKKPASKVRKNIIVPERKIEPHESAKAYPDTPPSKAEER